MKKLSRKELNKMQKQMGFSSRKSIEERGRFPRPVVFKDKKKDARKYAARKAVWPQECGERKKDEIRV